MKIYFKDKEYQVTEKDLIRFWSKVDFGPGLGPDGACWEWTGFLNYSGYGYFSVDCGRQIRSHRFIFLIDNILSDNECVLHHCDNRKCVNPKHLYIGTQQDNIRDARNRKRYASRRGEDASMAKLTWDQVKEIRSIDYNNFTLEEVGNLYGIAASKVSNIIRNISWKDDTFNPINIGRGGKDKKYSDDIVREIRKRYSNGERICDIARDLNVSYDSTLAIAHGKNRKNLI